MTNQDVIDLVSLGLPDDVVIDKIHAVTEADFDTSVPGLRALKAAKVPDAVIRIMVNPSSVGNAAPAGTKAVSSDNPALPPEVGVYMVHDGKLTEVQPEIVNWQTGGVLKSTATLFIVKGDKNGKVAGGKSPTRTNHLEFLIKTPEGTSVEEYQLLRLHQKGNRREFRSVTGGILHVSGGAQRDEVAFQPEKVGNRVWRIVMRGLPNGEYGFLPPGVASASISASGKMYTFGVAEENRTQASRNISLLPPPPPETPPTPASTVAPVPASPVVAPVSSRASEPPAPVVKSEPPPAPTETAVETKQKKPAYQCTEYTVDRLGLKNCTKWLLK